MPMKWYVVHTYSGHENKAKLSLLDRVRQPHGYVRPLGEHVRDGIGDVPGRGRDAALAPRDSWS